MDKLLEYKNFTGSLKDIDGSKRIATGYLSSFTKTPDSYGDVIEKGAFKRSLDNNKANIFFLNQHNWKQPLSKFNVLREDEKGLYFESNPIPNTSYGDDVIKLYEAGILNEHSIGYSTVKSEWNNDTEIRTLKEVKLYEGSVVTLGANPDTPFTGLKSKTLDEINDEVKNITKALRNGTFTDDTFILLEVALKQLQLDAYELGKKSLGNVDSSQDTLQEDSNLLAVQAFRQKLII